MCKYAHSARELKYFIAELAMGHNLKRVGGRREFHRCGRETPGVERILRMCDSWQEKRRTALPVSGEAA